MKEIDYIECANDFAVILLSGFEKMIEGKLDKLEIKNIPSQVFVILLNVNQTISTVGSVIGGAVSSIVIRHLMYQAVPGMAQ